MHDQADALQHALVRRTLNGESKGSELSSLLLLQRDVLQHNIQRGCVHFMRAQFASRSCELRYLAYDLLAEKKLFHEFRCAGYR